MKRFLLLAVVLVAVSTSGENRPDSERRFASRVSQVRLQTTVRELVRLGPRMGGTVSGDRSARYVARKFKEAGLDVEVLEDPERLTFTNRKWFLEVKEPRSLRGLIRNEWPGGFSPTVERTNAELIHLPQDVHITKESVGGKAVLLEKPFSVRFYQRLVEADVLCILLVAPKLDHAYSKWAYIYDLPPSAENGIPLFNISQSNGAKLIAALQDSQRVVIAFETQTVIEHGRPKTVVATMGGESDSYYIVCAHGDSDSGGPGADDNASGVAAVIEVARVLSGLKEGGIIGTPNVTIKFIVWGTEIASTEAFIKRNAEDLQKIVGVLNLDEVGSGAMRDCLYFESNDVEHNEQLLRTLESIGEEYVGTKGFWSEATTNPSQGGTDSYVFLPNSLRRLKVPVVEIPSVTIFTGAWNELRTIPQTPGWSSKAWKGHPDSVTIDFSAYYHSSLDVPELTTDKEPFNMVWAARAVGIALLRLAWSTAGS